MAWRWNWSEVQVGDFVNGILCKGTVTFVDGHIEEGVRVNGHLNGPGKVTIPGKYVEEGEYDDSRLNGPGKVTFDDGQVQEGNFVNGVLAKGTVTFVDGHTEE